MLNIYLLAFTIFYLIIQWQETPKGNEMATLEILTALVKGGMTPVGACAMGGNMMAESGMKSNIAQRGMTKLSDEEYTQAADLGVIDFIGDSVGYGLCQWTYGTRKQHLLDYAKSMGASVGDEFTQVQFCFAELKNEYPYLWEALKKATNLYDTTARVCHEYERPAIPNVKERAEYAKQLYKDYGDILQTAYVEYVEMKGYKDPVGAQGACGLEHECRGRLMATVRSGEHTPEACFLMAQLNKTGYDVLWLGLDACLRDLQQKRGLTVDGICGEKTWRELLR